MSGKHMLFLVAKILMIPSPHFTSYSIVNVQSFRSGSRSLSELTKEMQLRRMERSAKRMTNLERPLRKLTRG